MPAVLFIPTLVTIAIVYLVLLGFAGLLKELHNGSTLVYHLFPYRVFIDFSLERQADVVVPFKSLIDGRRSSDSPHPPHA